MRVRLVCALTPDLLNRWDARAILRSLLAESGQVGHVWGRQDFAEATYEAV